MDTERLSEDGHMSRSFPGVSASSIRGVRLRRTGDDQDAYEEKEVAGAKWPGGQRFASASLLNSSWAMDPAWVVVSDPHRQPADGSCLDG
jgi:hypothetical protein